MSTLAFRKFWLLFVMKIQNKVSACFYEITIVKIFPVALFRKLVPAFRKPPVTLRNFPKAAYDSENCSSAMNRESTNESEGKPERKCDAAHGTSCKLNKDFQRSKQHLYIYFSLEQGRLKI